MIMPASLMALLVACASPPASGQMSPADAAGVNRIDAYEVPVEESTQGSALQEVGQGWIQVSGTGSVTVEPDRATVSFAMETRATTAAEAAGQNADAMTSVLAAVRGAGLEGLELTTYGYSLNPEYQVLNDNRRTREIIAYQALNNIRATVSDIDAIGRLIDRAIGAGANRVASIGFFTANTDEARREALAIAVSSARAEAEVIARSLGYELGAPLEVSGGANVPIPRRMEGLAMSARAMDTPIEAGDQNVSDNVSVRFALGRELGG
jgi:uncharacterized protein YggE